MTTKETKTVKPVLEPHNTIFVIDPLVGGLVLKRNTNDEVSCVGMLPIDQISSCLSTEKPLATGILPTNCVYYEKVIRESGTYHMYLIQYRPFVATLKYHIRKVYTGGTKDSNPEFKVPLPYVQFGFTIKQLKDGTLMLHQTAYVFCTKKPIMDVKDRLLQLPLQNFYPGSGAVCFGNTDALKRNNADSLNEYVNKLPASLLTSKFSDHYTPNWPPEVIDAKYDWSYAQYDPTANFNKWIKLCENNPLKVLEFGFVNSNHTIESLITYMRTLCL